MECTYIETYNISVLFRKYYARINHLKIILFYFNSSII